MLTKIFTSTNVVVNQWLFHHHGYQNLVLILLLGIRLSTKSKPTSISIFTQQSSTPLAKCLFKLSSIIGIISVKLEQHGQYLTLNFALILVIPKLFVVVNQHMVFTRQKSWRRILRSWRITTEYETALYFGVLFYFWLLNRIKSLVFTLIIFLAIMC